MGGGSPTWTRSIHGHADLASHDATAWRNASTDAQIAIHGGDHAQTDHTTAFRRDAATDAQTAIYTPAAAAPNGHTASPGTTHWRAASPGATRWHNSSANAENAIHTGTPAATRSNASRTHRLSANGASSA